MASNGHGHEFEQTPGDAEGQGGLACCSLLGHKVSDILVTEQQQVDYHTAGILFFLGVFLLDQNFHCSQGLLIKIWISHRMGIPMAERAVSQISLHPYSNSHVFSVRQMWKTAYWLL